MHVSCLYPYKILYITKSFSVIVIVINIVFKNY